MRLHLTLRDIFELAALLYVFLIPISLRSIVYQSPASQLLTFNPYTTFFLYASDVVLIALIMLFAIGLWRGTFDIIITKNKYHRAIWIGLLSFFILHNASALFAADPVLIFLKSIRLLFLYIFLYLAAYYLPIHRLLHIFIVSMCMQSFIALLQYALQGSIGLSFLGEPTFNRFSLGTAKTQLGAETFVRSYGTTLHPNVLGGLFFIALSSAYYFYTKRKTLIWIAALSALILGLMLTFSRLAILAFIFSGCIWIILQWRRISRKTLKTIAAISLGSIFVLSLISSSGSILVTRFQNTISGESFAERVEGITAGLRMLVAHPLGVGAHHSTLHIQSFSDQKLMPWEHQPTHMIPLLLANELGFWVPAFIIALIVYIFFVLRKLPYFFLQSFKLRMSSLAQWLMIGCSFIALGDHYFITNQSAMTSVMLIMVIIFHGLTYQKAARKKVSIRSAHR